MTTARKRLGDISRLRLLPYIPALSIKSISFPALASEHIKKPLNRYLFNWIAALRVAYDVWTLKISFRFSWKEEENWFLHHGYLFLFISVNWFVLPISRSSAELSWAEAGYFVYRSPPSIHFVLSFPLKAIDCAINVCRQWNTRPVTSCIYKLIIWAGRYVWCGVHGCAFYDSK